MKKFIFTTILILGILIIGRSSVASAAAIRPTQLSSKDGVTTVAVMVDPENQSINTIAGSLHYDPNVLSIKAIRTVDSIVTFWVDQPKETTPGVITWAGVIPGGFDGVRNALTNDITPGMVFQLVITPVSTGTSTIFLDSLDIRLNDGKATSAVVTTTPLSLTVDQKFRNAVIDPERSVSEADASFRALLAHDPALASGKWAVVFTVDNSRITIDHYEVAESFRSDPSALAPSQWHTVESPYILNDQYRTHYVHIRAIAQNGQTYVTTIAPIDFSTATSPLTWGILLLVIIALVLAIVRRKQRRT